MAGINYILKFDKNDKLYNYIELNRYDKVISFLKLEGNKLIRFDRNTQTKQMIQYKIDVELKQKIMNGDSFVSVFAKNSNNAIQYDFPEMNWQITLINNLVSTSSFGKFVVERYKYIKSKENKG
jgi:hypothetical protein